MKAEDAIRVIIAGYNDPTHRGAMTEFFLKQLKKAQAEQQDPEEFFWYCHNALRTLEGDLRRQLDIDSRALTRDLRAATAKGDTNTIEAIEADIRGLRVDAYSVNLSAVTEGKCDGYMTYQEVKDISDSFKKAELEFCNRPEEMVRHFDKTHRTPLSVPLALNQKLTDEHFSRFCTFLDHLTDERRKSRILIAIDDITDRIKTLRSQGRRNEEVDKCRLQIETLQKKLEGTTEKSWDSLYAELSGRFIDGVSLPDFNYVMDKKRLPDRRVNVRINWIGKFPASRLALFGQEMGFTWGQLNACFLTDKGREVREGDIPKPYKKSNPTGKPDSNLREFKALLDKHKNQ